MLQADIADDFVLATGETHSVREFVELACTHVGITLQRTGSGIDEIGQDATTGKTIIRIDPKYYRPCEVEILLGDATKAKEQL